MSTHDLAEPDSPPAPVIMSEGRHAPATLVGDAPEPAEAPVAPTAGSA